MTTRTMVAGGVAGLGLAIGGLAVASADDTEPPTPPGTSQSPEGTERGAGHHGGPLGGGELAAALADELGVSEDDVRAAWQAVRDDVLPERPEPGKRDGDGAAPTPPSDADRDAVQQRLAAALAEELDLPEADVEAALETVREDAEQRFTTEARQRLVERLDEAVADGDLTAADKASVLKAFEAGVLGGGPGAFGGPGGHGPR